MVGPWIGDPLINLVQQTPLVNTTLLVSNFIDYGTWLFPDYIFDLVLDIQTKVLQISLPLDLRDNYRI